MINRLLTILFTVLVVVSGIWVFVAHSFDSVVALIGAIAALIGTFVIEKQPKQQQQQQNQSISDSSSGIQAGRDVNITGDKNVKSK